MPSPLDAIEAELDSLGDSLRKMNEALPAFERWARFGIKDPAGIDEPPPPRDPLEPVRSYGGFMLAEKRVAYDDHGRPNGGDAVLKVFELPQLQQQVEPRDLDARATAAALNHRRFQRD